MNTLAQFKCKHYLNLETFRKSGAAVRTPVWFCQEGEETLYALTMAESGKVKRIRANGCVNIAPSRMDGAPVGRWIPAVARVIDDPRVFQKVDRLLDKKYGLMKKLFQINSKKDRHSVILELKVAQGAVFSGQKPEISEPMQELSDQKSVI